MKRIYAFTLDSDDYPSVRFRQNLRLIAFLLHDLIYNYDGEGFTPLIINKTIGFNTIHTGYGENQYYLQYDEFNEKYINYEPFLIGNRSFALTVDDSLIDEDVIYNLMDQVLLLANVDYKYTIKTISYGSKNKEDESNRKKAVHQLSDIIEIINDKKKDLVKKKVFDMVSFKKRIGLL